MSAQNQQVADTVVPKTNASVPSLESCSEPLFDVEQAAEYLSMSAKWIYRNYTTLPHILIGAGPKPRIKFRRCDLDAWIRRHRIV